MKRNWRGDPRTSNAGSPILSSCHVGKKPKAPLRRFFTLCGSYRRLVGRSRLFWSERLWWGRFIGGIWEGMFCILSQYAAIRSIQQGIQRLARLLALTCLIAYSVIDRSAVAAEIVLDRATDPAIVTVVGTLFHADGQKFTDAISGIGKAIVVFSSDGGSVIAGLSIGKAIRFRNFRTAVPDGVRCASACALAWLGGTNRYMSENARVGFHAAYIKSNDGVRESGAANALVGAYLGNLGLSDAAVLYISSTPPDDIQWLTMADARRFGIDVALLPPMADVARGHSAPDQSTPPIRQPAPSTGPSPAIASLEGKASAFVGQYFGRWSDNNALAMTYVRNIYADSVDFYRKPTSRATIVDMKQKFTERWPERTYAVRWATVAIKCDQQSATCMVSGLVDWACYSPVRGAKSVGLAGFTVGVLFGANQMPSVYFENGSVVTRTASP